MRSLLAMLFSAAAVTAPHAVAATSQGTPSRGPWQCWNEAARLYQVDVGLLYAIARVESGARSGVVSGNTNGSYDIGVMQINSSWLGKLSRYGITVYSLRNDACLNVKVGAWLLSQTIRDHGLNWRGIGAYNAVTDAKRAVYARKVAKELERVRAEHRVHAPDLAVAANVTVNDMHNPPPRTLPVLVEGIAQ